MTKEAQQKFGLLFQFGVDYMNNFNQDAELFLATYNLYSNQLKQNGYSRQWDDWKENNQALIIRLYDALNAANLIPTSPTSN
jgi:hypothetical protein